MFKHSETRFQATWKTEFVWVQESAQKGYAKCTLCQRDFVFKTMGRSALVSHCQGKKHREQTENISKSVPLHTFFGQLSNVSSSRFSSTATSQLAITSAKTSLHQNCQSSSVPQHHQSTLDRFKIRDEVTKAEIVWCLYTVMTHSSLRDTETCVKVSKKLYPDSTIASEVKLGKDKIAYGLSFGIAPYYRDLLTKDISSCNFFVVGFDESLNSVAQKQQMDLSLRFWKEGENRVSARYFNSMFLHRGRAEDLLPALVDGLSSLDHMKVAQVSMDGPNVNKKLLRLYNQEYRADDESPKLLDLGSCGLHVLHVAFKTGMKKTGWELDSILRTMFYLFKGSPARRGVFIKATDSIEFPKPFFSVRWLENGDVANTALYLLPYLQVYVKSVEGTSLEPECNSFKALVKYLKDKLLSAKLAFFQSLAEDLEPFLTKFQSDAPLTPFLYDSLVHVLKTCMKRIVKVDVLANMSLEKVDVMEKEGNHFVNLLYAKEIDIGYAARGALKKIKNVSEKDMLLFRQDCRTCLQFLIAKLLERCPLKYPLTKALTFLNPMKVASSPDTICTQLNKAMDIVMNANLLSTSVIQKADREYRALISRDAVIIKMKGYSIEEDRLDEFWSSIFDTCTETANLRKVSKLLLILSHGNATLERGFSVNKEVVVENLLEQSLVAQRLVYDSVMAAGGLWNVEVPKLMILSMRNANSRWKEALKERRRSILGLQEQRAEKRKSDAVAKELVEKKRKIQKKSAEEVAAIEEELKAIQRK